jgi:hypothetical protein
MWRRYGAKYYTDCCKIADTIVYVADLNGLKVLSACVIFD